MEQNIKSKYFDRVDKFVTTQKSISDNAKIEYELGLDTLHTLNSMHTIAKKCANDDIEVKAKKDLDEQTSKVKTLKEKFEHEKLELRMITKSLKNLEIKGKK